MASKILDCRKEKQLQPATFLWAAYDERDARHAFKAKTASEAEAWQKETRRALAAALGFQNLPQANPVPKKIESVDKGDYVREKIVIRTSKHSVMPFYLLLPKEAKRPLPVVLAFHGHGYGAKDIVGLWEDGEERAVPDGYHHDFGVALCRRGFAVAAPEIACFGERQSDFSYLDNTKSEGLKPQTCHHSAMLAFHLGGSVVGLRIAEGRRLTDFLAGRKDLDANRLGAMGISGGGMHAFFSSCMDIRIKACVVSGYYSTFRDSLLAMSHCPCNFVPGLRSFGEMHDLIGLIAPRPVLVEAGSHDPLFPVEAVKRSVEIANRVYRKFDRSRRVETDFFEGRHRINGKQAYDFLSRSLNLR